MKLYLKKYFKIIYYIKIFTLILFVVFKCKFYFINKIYKTKKINGIFI